MAKKWRGSWILCLLGLACGTGMLSGCGSREIEIEESADMQETSAPEQTTEAIQITQQETTPEAWSEPEEEAEPYVSPIDFEALWEINPDVIGWITVEGTNIDYPILYGPDNEKYLHTSLEGDTTVAGSIFLDCDDQPDFSSLHNVLYGHHMKNGSMFKDVVYYKEQDFFDEHKEIVIYTPEREIHLRPLAALYTSADPIRRKTSFRSWKGFKTYMKAMTEGGLTSAAPECPIDRIYSLVTCSYEFNDARTILYAYEVGESAGSGGTSIDMETWERYWATEAKTYRKRLVLPPVLVAGDRS